MALPTYQPDRSEDRVSLEPRILNNPGEIRTENAPAKRTDFAFHVFFLVFWLTLIATVLISWKMIVVQL